MPTYIIQLKTPTSGFDIEEVIFRGRYRALGTKVYSSKHSGRFKSNGQYSEVMLSEDTSLFAHTNAAELARQLDGTARQVS